MSKLLTVLVLCLFFSASFFSNAQEVDQDSNTQNEGVLEQLEQTRERIESVDQVEANPISVSREEQAAREIVLAYHKSLRTFKCGFSQHLLKSLEKTNDTDLKEIFEKQLDKFNSVISQAKVTNENKKNYRMLKKVRKLYKKLAKKNLKRKKVKKFFLNACKVSEKVLTAVPKGLGYAVKLADQLLTVPVNSVYFFMKGLVTGKEAKTFGQGEHFFMESESINYGVSYYLLDKVLLNSLSVPLWQAFAASAVGKQIVSNICKDKNKYNTSELKYCQAFNNIERFNNKISAATQKAGSKLKFWGKKKAAKKKKKNEETLKNITELNNDNICEYLDASRTERKSSIQDQFYLIFNPDKFGEPLTQEFHTDASKMMTYPNFEMANMKNVIIALGPGELYEEEVLNEKLDEIKKLNKKIKKQEKKLRKIVRAKNIEKCKKRLESSKFDFKEYMDLKEELGKHTAYRKHVENLVLNKIVKKSQRKFSLGGKLKLNWELHQANDVNQALDILRSNKVANLIIVSHGVQNGKIVDSQLNQYHSRIFENISPSIMSISFFTCYSQKIKKIYKIDEILSHTPSYHKMRQVFFVKENYFFNKSGQVPLNSLESFIKRVDKQIYRSLKGNLLFQISSPGFMNLDLEKKKMCRILVKSPKIVSGSIGITLNRNFLGVIDSKNSKTIFEYECNQIKSEGENTLLFYGANLKERLRIDQSRIDYQFLDLDQESIDLIEEKFYDKEGKIAGGKIKFSAN
jgi:hypothetical protein